MIKTIKALVRNFAELRYFSVSVKTSPIPLRYKINNPIKITFETIDKVSFSFSVISKSFKNLKNKVSAMVAPPSPRANPNKWIIVNKSLLAIKNSTIITFEIWLYSQEYFVLLLLWLFGCL